MSEVIEEVDKDQEVDKEVREEELMSVTIAIKKAIMLEIADLEKKELKLVELVKEVDASFAMRKVIRKLIVHKEEEVHQKEMITIEEDQDLHFLDLI